MESKEKKISKNKIILIAMASVILAAVGFVGSLMISLFVRYHTTSYESVDVVEREDEYIMPELPEIIVDTDGIWQEGVDLESAETDETEETVEAETDNSMSLDEIVSPERTYEAEPQETLPQTVNQPSNSSSNGSQQTAAASSNTDASFSNSQNVVNVYGKTPIYKVEQKDSDVLNILVMGTDTRDVTSDRGRSDTMIVVSYNKTDGTLKLTSLLRDSLVPIEGYGWNRINTAYFFGGVGLAINTVNQLYDLDIQSFVVIDFNGVKDFVDYIGGVDLTLTAEEAELYSAYTGRKIEEGLNHLDSELAMTHMQNRAIGNDFGRTQRQRDTITAIMTQILTRKSFTEIYDIAEYAFTLVKTNLSVTTILSLAASVISQVSQLTIETQNVPYSDAYQFAWYNGMSIISFDISDAAERLNGFIYD